jgi:DNA-binding NarL/FixJ family response regulator
MLHVSPKTVDRHRTNLMSKLDLHDRTEVVKYALRQQLIDL